MVTTDKQDDHECGDDDDGEYDDEGDKGFDKDSEDKYDDDQNDDDRMMMVCGEDLRKLGPR